MAVAGASAAPAVIENHQVTISLFQISFVEWQNIRMPAWVAEWESNSGWMGHPSICWKETTHNEMSMVSWFDARGKHVLPPLLGRKCQKLLWFARCSFWKEKTKQKLQPSDPSTIHWKGKSYLPHPIHKLMKKIMKNYTSIFQFQITFLQNHRECVRVSWGILWHPCGLIIMLWE